MAGLFICRRSMFCTRRLHTVKPHIPSIRFPERFPPGKSPLAAEKRTTVASDTMINESSINIIGLIDDSDLPIKYRRMAILPEEMLYIERGGPE